MIKHLHGFIFLLLVREVMSELGKLEHGLEYELTRCLLPLKRHLDETSQYSIIQSSRDISTCWRTTMKKCVGHNIQIQTYFNLQLMCGVINTGKCLMKAICILDLTVLYLPLSSFILISCYFSIHCLLHGIQSYKWPGSFYAFTCGCSS